MYSLYKKCFKQGALLLLLAAALLLTSCTQYQGATEHGFYSDFSPKFQTGINPSLQLLATGKLWTSVPTDISAMPSVSFAYGIFSDVQDQQVVRSAHIIISSTPKPLWQFKLISTRPTGSFSFEKEHIGPDYWTSQIYLMPSAKDWISNVYTVNSINVPDVWLAKRWFSSHPQDIRIIKEYREPAPECLSSLAGEDTNRLEAWSRCSTQLEDFSQRADTAFVNTSLDTAQTVTTPSVRLPNMRPDIKALVGEVEAVEHERGGVYLK